MSDIERYHAAAIEADMRKAQFLDDIGVARDRISPARLQADAKARVSRAVADTRQRAKQTARRHPLAIGAIMAGLVAYILRRPLFALGRRLLTRARPAPQPAPPPPAPAPAPAPPVTPPPPQPETS